MNLDGNIPPTLNSIGSWFDVFIAIKDGWSGTDPYGPWVKSHCTGVMAENADKPINQGSVNNTSLTGSGASVFQSNLVNAAGYNLGILKRDVDPSFWRNVKANPNDFAGRNGVTSALIQSDGMGGFVAKTGLTLSGVQTVIQNRLHYQKNWLDTIAASAAPVTITSMNIVNEPCDANTTDGWRPPYDGSSESSIWITLSDALFSGATTDAKRLALIDYQFAQAQAIITPSYPNIAFGLNDFDIEYWPIEKDSSPSGAAVTYTNSTYFVGAQPVYTGYNAAKVKIERTIWLLFNLQLNGRKVDYFGMQGHFKTVNAIDPVAIRRFAWLLTRWGPEPVFTEINMKEVGGAGATNGVYPPQFAESGDSSDRVRMHGAWYLYRMLNTWMGVDPNGRYCSKLRKIRFWTDATDAGPKTATTLMGGDWTAGSVDKIFPPYYGIALALQNSVDPALRTNIPDIAPMDFRQALPFFATTSGTVDVTSGGARVASGSGGLTVDARYFQMKAGTLSDALTSGAWRFQWAGAATPADGSVLFEVYTTAGDTITCYFGRVASGETAGDVYFRATDHLGASAIAPTHIGTPLTATTGSNSVLIVRNGDGTGATMTACLSTLDTSTLPFSPVLGTQSATTTFTAGKSIPTPNFIAVLMDHTGANTPNGHRARHLDWIGSSFVDVTGLNGGGKDSLATLSTPVNPSQPYFAPAIWSPEGTISGT